MVFQSFNLFPHRTVLENVIEAPDLRPGPAPRRRPRRGPAGCSTASAWSTGSHALPAQLSGGQQQRVAIARALAMEPQAILFDEPTSALDPRMTAEVLAVMTDLARDGLTMIVVTHAMQFARQVAHTVHVFGDGRVVESGPARPDLRGPAPGGDPDPALGGPGGVSGGPFLNAGLDVASRGERCCPQRDSGFGIGDSGERVCGRYRLDLNLLDPNRGEAANPRRLSRGNCPA